MMKSFFKKLAFVMALAMVVTMAAPAAQAAVAADKALAITYQNENHYTISEVNLASVGDSEDLKFLWAPSNWKELGAKWSSSNENVVTVDASGVVTGVAAGSANVTVAIGTESATVTVNVEELPAYTVSIGEGEDREVTERTMEIGEEVDFAFYGIKDYSRDKVGALPRYLCTWQSDDTTVLRKDDDAGKFTAIAAGTAKVTLTVANVLTGQTHNVIPVAVTVNAPVVEEPEEQNIVAELNKTQDTIEIDLASNAGLNLYNVEVFRVFFADDDYNGDGKIDDFDIDNPYESIYVEAVNWNSATGKWDVVTFDDFIDGVTYEVQVKGYEPERFVASVGDVATVEVLEKSGAYLATDDLALVPAYVYVKLYDAKGVDVTTRVVNGVVNSDESNVTFWLTDDTTTAYAMTGYDEIEFYEMATAGVMATFDNSGKPVESVDPCLLTPETVETYGIKRIVSWTLVNEAEADSCEKHSFAHVTNWATEVNHSVPAGEYDYIIVTLLEDTRGVYFTTHENSATAKSGVQYNGKDVYYTEDYEKAFWIYGYRVEYRAMDPDKMVVEDFGEIASYEEGKARFALYLYNQNNGTDEFIKELYSQYVNVCHPMEMTGMSATSAVEITMNTEQDDERNGIALDEENAYYSIWSTAKINVKMLDIHNTASKAVLAKTTEADTAKFTVELISSAMPGETAVDVNSTPDDTTDDVDLYQALKDLVATWEEELNKDYEADDTASNNRNIAIEANDFAGLFAKRTLIKIKITEAVTKKTATVSITLRRPALEVEGYNEDGTPIYGESAALGTIDEYTDELKTDLVSFEKYTLRTKNLSVDQYKAASTSLLLFQIDKTGKEIGVENNIYVSNVLYTEKNGVSQVKESDIVGADTLKVGDRVIFVKDSAGNVYGDGNTAYENPDYTAKKVWSQYEMPTDATGLGVTIDNTVDKIDNKEIKTASGTAFTVNQYKFNFVSKDDTGELVFAKEGRYTATIKTVKEIKADGTVVFTKNTGLTSTVTITVSNSKPEVTLAKRVLTRVEDAYISTYFDGATKNVEYGDDAAVKELILAAYDFNLGSSALSEDPANILYYTYTVTPTNKQVVINDVVFKVACGDGWYRSTAKVNKSLTFDYE